MKRSTKTGFILLQLFIVLGVARGFAQAPGTIAGFTYRDSTSQSLIPYVYLSSLDFRTDGTYLSRALIDENLIPGTASYLPPVSGSFSYAILSQNRAALTLNPNGGVPESLTLSFIDNVHGSVIRGNGTGSGNFFLSPTATGATTALLNVSSLVMARQGAPATMGFVVGGTQLREFLIRSVGPSLTVYGVTSPATNPVYMLYTAVPYGVVPLPGASQTVPVYNPGAGWTATSASTATITAETARAGAFPLTLGSNDKADVYLLSPGAYTVVVSPEASSSEGSDLIEVYEIQ